MGRLTLRRQLIALFLAIGLIPLVATSIVNLVSINDALRNRVIEEEQIRVDSQVEELQRFLDTTNSDLALLRDSFVMRNLTSAIATSDLLQIQEARHQAEQEFVNMVNQRKVANVHIYEHIRFLDADGFELVRIDNVDGQVQVASGVSLNFRSSEDYYRQAKSLPDGGVYVSEIELFDEFGRIQEPHTPVLRYSTPVYVDNTVIGVLVTDVRAKGFLDLVQLTTQAETTSLLVDPNGYYLSHPDPKKLYGGDLGTGFQLQQDYGELSLILREPQDGVKEFNNQIVVYHPLYAGEGETTRYWMIFAISPLNSVLAPVQQQQNILLYGLVAAGALVVLIAFLFARNISKPIVELTNTSAAIASGNLFQRASITRHDEIGQLAHSFNSMTDQLSGLINTLEDRVNARTRDLQIAADVSRQITTVLDIDSLLKQISVLTVRNFDLYGAFVFRLSDDKQNLICASIADASRTFRDPTQIDPIPLQTKPSIVALTARTRHPIVIGDVKSDPNYLSHHLFPDTRSEMAIPFILGGRVLGVFDLQSREVNRFGDEEQRVLTSLTEQVGVAIRNAELYTQTQAARKAAEEANKFKTMFFANMSHELRTPLNAILNFTDLVATGAFGEVNEEQSNALDLAFTNGQHLLSLINDILDITKIDAGMMSLFTETFKLDSLLDEVMATCEALIGDKSVELIREFDSLPEITGDKRRIRQILMNLTSNAIKFTETGSVTVKASHNGDMIHFMIKDTGVGIDPADLETIFEPFRQSHAGMREASGTGLGLAISRHLAQAHGGNVRVESEFGKGAVFYVDIPVNQVKKLVQDAISRQ